MLEDTLLGYQVESFTNTKKRKAIATSKFYFFDIGIARALRNIPAPKENTSEFGEYFEHLICMELKSWIDYKHPRSRLTYWRSTSNMEVDFCVDEEKLDLLATFLQNIIHLIIPQWKPLFRQFKNL